MATWTFKLFRHEKTFAQHLHLSALSPEITKTSQPPTRRQRWPPPCKPPGQRWANNSVFEYIRIVRTEYIRKPNYSVLFKNRIIFVFVFGFNFQTECIRIRIRFLFLNRIHSYSYSVFIFEPNIFVFVFGLYFETE